MKGLNKRHIIDLITSEAGHYSFGLLDLSSKKTLEYNSEFKMHSASIIKLYYLYAALKLVESNELELNTNYMLDAEEIVGGCGVLKLLNPGRELSLRELLYLMIDLSDNTATNMLFDIIGKDRLNAEIKKIGATQTCAARKLMRVIPGLYSYTTVKDTLLVLKHLTTGESLTDASISLAKDILSKQQLNDLLSFEWDNTTFFHKTGEIDGVIHDAGMVEIAGKEYLIALFSCDIENNKKTKCHFNKIGSELYTLLEQEDLFCE